MSNVPLCEEWLDIWGWIAAFPPVSEWKTNSESINPCRQSQLPLLLTAEKETLKPWNEPPNIILSLRANFEPNPIVLWNSNAFNLVHADCNSAQDNPRSSLFSYLIGRILNALNLVHADGNSAQDNPRSSLFSYLIGRNSNALNLVDADDNSAQNNPMSSLFSDFIDRILKNRPPQEEPQYQNSKALAKSIDSKIFNCAFFLMVLSVSVYEAPTEIRLRCLEALDRQWRASGAWNSFELLLQAVGSNTAQLVMRSMALTLIDRMASDNPLNPLSRDSTIRSPLSFFQSHCTKDEWKFQVYAPVFAMEAADEKPIKSPKDFDLLRALGFLHLEACLLLKYSVNFTPHSIEVQIGLANVICDVFQLLSTDSLEESVAKEKHFPSQISVDVTLLDQCNRIFAFPSTCTNNDLVERSRETNCSGSLNWETKLPIIIGGSVTYGVKEGWTTNFRPWNIEQTAGVGQGKYLYFLVDKDTGKKVTGYRPSQKNNGWFRDKDSYVSSGFSAKGGITICSKEGITWKFEPKMEGRTFRWKVEGKIWVTYWPNKYKSSYSETRRLSFSEIVEMDLTR